MSRLLLTLAAAAVFGLAGATAGHGRTVDPVTHAQIGQILPIQIAPHQIAQADDKVAPKTSVKKTTRKRTRKAKRKTKRRYTYGKVYLTAYAKNGRQRKAGKFGTRLRLYAKATKSRKTRKGKRRAGRTEAVEYCGKTYYTTKRGTRWIGAHEKAGHVLVVRRHTARKKFKAVCGKPPKRVKRRTARKKSATKKKTVKKVDKES